MGAPWGEQQVNLETPRLPRYENRDSEISHVTREGSFVFPRTYSRS